MVFKTGMKRMEWKKQDKDGLVETRARTNP
jgi:hypothetical protein